MAAEQMQPLDLNKLPDDLALLKSIIFALVAETEKIKTDYDRVLHRLSIQLNHRFGRRSETVSPDQMALFQQLIEAQLADIPKPAESEPEPKIAVRAHGRRKPPKDLPKNTVYYPLPDDMKLCPECNGPLEEFGKQARIQINYKPASAFVDEQIADKYCCPACRGVVVTSPLPPLPIKRGLYGTGFLAETVVSKFDDHAPAARQVGMLARHGLIINDSTIGDCIGQCANLLEPIYFEMKAEVLKSKDIHTDDTPVSVLEKVAKKPKGQVNVEVGDQSWLPKEHKRARQGRFWVYIGDKNHPYHVYDYSPNREGKYPINFLGAWSGYLHGDAYGGYDALFDVKKSKGYVIEVACGAHIRRYFKKAYPTDKERGKIALAYYHELSKIETTAHDFDPQARRELREKCSRPVLEKFKQWIDEQTPDVLPESAMGEALRYARNQWNAFMVYLDDGDLTIDNNMSERALRRIAVGRGNWGKLGTDEGGRWAAIHYSIIATCKQHGIDPFAYLEDVLGKLGGARTPETNISDLLPPAWAAARKAKLTSEAAVAALVPTPPIA